MKIVGNESLFHDAIHGYMPFTSRERAFQESLQEGLQDEVVESDLIDHRWIQRLRKIHQLQSAWLVYPTAEHTRFQHVIAVMHVASLAIDSLYDSLKEVCPEVPSRGYVESLMRLAGLLHDVGHGPFGHFFDEHFLSHYDLTHESLGGIIITEELGDLIRKIRRNPHSQLLPDEQLDPGQIAMLINRPKSTEVEEHPRWLSFLQSLFSGIYTIDNMDFVLRDAYMTGYSTRAFDMDRLLKYSYFSEKGLTIHQRGVDALLRFISVRAELFRSIYFHRTVRGIDLSLKDLFEESRELIFPGNPREHLSQYQQFTEWSLLSDVGSWYQSDDPKRAALGQRWQKFLNRETPWKMVCQRSLVFGANDSEKSSLFSKQSLLENAVRDELPQPLKTLPIKVDLARLLHRPESSGPTAGLNFMYDPTSDQVRSLSDHQIYRHLPIAQRICRIYAESLDHAGEITKALDNLIGPGGSDDLTNM